ncbi:hypothetical protein N7447_003450 [Penicillium robsamsonii]|uniref:uncharacterized protein n=1 Tax=Penicillium robsamsonii TaxID=1792511 RepID=UPI00254935F6|nr:uncharacterized protein N7447_003450 [Penicillium robsamsonii]KAJ5826687.1 hypothetical protein N7447_003450 [Penicillium robsamsonii]
MLAHAAKRAIQFFSTPLSAFNAEDFAPPIHLDSNTCLISSGAAAAIDAEPTGGLGITFLALLAIDLLVGKFSPGPEFKAYVAGEELSISGIISNWEN